MCIGDDLTTQPVICFVKSDNVARLLANKMNK